VVLKVVFPTESLACHAKEIASNDPRDPSLPLKLFLPSNLSGLV